MPKESTPWQQMNPISEPSPGAPGPAPCLECGHWGFLLASLPPSLILVLGGSQQQGLHLCEFTSQPDNGQP